MAATVKILVEGRTNADSVAEAGEEKTQPTITLVRDGKLVIVVDPGILESQQVLIDALAKEKLTVEDVDVVCITHSHLDHYRNVGIFPKSKVLEFFGLWDKNTVEDWPEQFSTNIQILKTPGDDYTGITLFVTTDEGVVAICGDVFWKENYPQDPKDDAYASEPEKLEKSRELILRMADWIIPGHAGMYKAEKIQPGIFENLIAKLKPKSEKPAPICKNCKTVMKPQDKCPCRSQLCFRCCECGIDCDNCSCSHKR
jgi:glyoxylase-like metal-dependent hydrolase (beta-lactamase superfamily II)